MPTLREIMPQTFSQSTTAYTLGLRTLVYDAEGQQKNLFTIMGRIQTFTPSQARTLEKIFEINTASGGEAVEIVPGGIPDDNIAISRIDVYPVPFIIAFGGLEANNLRTQNIPFTFAEYRFDPKDVPKSMVLEYVNCLLEDFSDPIEIEGAPVIVDGTAQVGFRRSYLLFGEEGSLSFSETNINAFDWASFRPDLGAPGGGGREQGIPLHRTIDKGLETEFTIIDRSGLAGLANVCAEFDAQPTS